MSLRVVNYIKACKTCKYNTNLNSRRKKEPYEQLQQNHFVFKFMNNLKMINSIDSINCCLFSNNQIIEFSLRLFAWKLLTNGHPLKITKL